MKTLNTKKRRAVKNKFNGHCAYCGCKPEKLCVDHIIPKRNFLFHIQNNFEIPIFLQHLGDQHVNHIDNLFPACQSCNSYKSALSLEKFREEIGKLVDRLNNYANQFNLVKRFGLVVETGEPVIFFFEKAA